MGITLRSILVVRRRSVWASYEGAKDSIWLEEEEMSSEQMCFSSGTTTVFSMSDMLGEDTEDIDLSKLHEEALSERSK